MSLSMDTLQFDLSWANFGTGNHLVVTWMVLQLTDDLTVIDTTDAVLLDTGVETITSVSDSGSQTVTATLAAPITLNLNRLAVLVTAIKQGDTVNDPGDPATVYIARGAKTGAPGVPTVTYGHGDAAITPLTNLANALEIRGYDGTASVLGNDCTATTTILLGEGNVVYPVTQNYGGIMVTSPTAPYGPTPEHESIDIEVSLASLAWSFDGTVIDYDVYLGPTGDETLLEEGVETETVAIPSGTLLYSTEYSWYVVAHTSGGDFTSSTWTFTTMSLSPPVPTAENAMITKRRLLAASDNKIWYEDI